MAKQLYRQSRLVRISTIINIDNGSGTTTDEVLFNSGPTGAHLVRVYFMYEEIAGTVAAGNFKLGVAVGGATLVAATAYTNSAAIGATTEAPILLDVVPANTTVWLRHTGVGATALGTGKVFVEYTLDE